MQPSWQSQGGTPNGSDFSAASWTLARAGARTAAKEFARSNLLDYTLYTFPQFQLSWHHEVICGFVDDWIAGKFDRGMIFTPPRHSKSEMVSRRAPSYILGKFPDDFVLACSYGGELAGTMGRDVQRIMDSPLYARLFPGTRLPTRQDRGYKRIEDFFELPGHRGYYRSAGIGKGITGFGMHWGIIDDPIKSRQEAGSATFRRRLQEWYQDDFYSRLQQGAKILLTCTRWDSDDLAGWLLQKAQEEPGADQWTVLSLPAIAEGEANPKLDKRTQGEALWPNRFPVEDLSDLNVLRNLSEIEAVRSITEGFKSAINALTVQDRGTTEIRDTIKLSKTRPHLVKDQAYLVPKRSVFNKVVADNAFELDVTAFLDGCPDIISFVKNSQSTQFRMEYRNAEGSIANYYPDFLVKRSESEIWVIEGKGREDLDDPPKWERLQQWCADATAHDGKRAFKPLFVRQEAYEKYQPKDFAGLCAMAG